MSIQSAIKGTGAPYGFAKAWKVGTRSSRSDVTRISVKSLAVCAHSKHRCMVSKESAEGTAGAVSTSNILVRSGLADRTR